MDSSNEFDLGGKAFDDKTQIKIYIDIITANLDIINHIRKFVDTNKTYQELD